MNRNEILSAIDAEISRLTQVRTLLRGLDDRGISNSSRPGASTRQGNSTASDSPGERRRGRPKGSKNKATSFNPAEFAPKRRAMSAAGKERIAAAQRARWAKQKGTGQAAKKSGPAATKKAGTSLAAKTTASPARKVVVSKGTRSLPAEKAGLKKGAVKAAPAKKVTVKVAAKPAAKQSSPAKRGHSKKVPANAAAATAVSEPMMTLEANATA